MLRHRIFSFIFREAEEEMREEIGERLQKLKLIYKVYWKGHEKSHIIWLKDKVSFQTSFREKPFNLLLKKINMTIYFENLTIGLPN